MFSTENTHLPRVRRTLLPRLGRHAALQQGSTNDIAKPLFRLGLLSWPFQSRPHDNASEERVGTSGVAVRHDASIAQERRLPGQNAVQARSNDGSRRQHRGPSRRPRQGAAEEDLMSLVMGPGHNHRHRSQHGRYRRLRRDPVARRKQAIKAKALLCLISGTILAIVLAICTSKALPLATLERS